MSAYTVESVVSQEEWAGNRGQMVTYELMLQGEDQTVNLTRQATSQAPSAGDSLDGEIEANSKGRKLKLAYSGPPSGGGSGGGDDFERRPDHPVQMQRALHTSALSTAPVLIEQMLTLSIIEAPKTKDEYLTLVEGVATWAQGTYPKAVLEQAAKADGQG